MLHGRDADCAAVRDLLDAARLSRSGVAVVRGEPGVGKTALLQYAAEQAQDMHVLHGVGVQSEVMLSFAALHQLLGPVLERLPALPAPQAAALAGAFGMTPGRGFSPCSASDSSRILSAFGVADVYGAGVGNPRHGRVAGELTETGRCSGFGSPFGLSARRGGTVRTTRPGSRRRPKSYQKPRPVSRSGRTAARLRHTGVPAGPWLPEHGVQARANRRSVPLALTGSLVS